MQRQRLVFGFLLLILVWRVWTTWPSNQSDLAGQTVTLSGVVSRDPDRRDSTTMLVVNNILLTVPNYPEFNYGDEVTVTGKLVKPASFETTSGKTFDYGAYLSKDDIYYQMFRPKIELVSTGHGWPILAGLYYLKQSFLDNLARALPEPHAALLGGITIGAKRGLPPDWQDKFRTVGLSHVVVLSGYNITIVAKVIAQGLAWLPPAVGLGTGALGIILFTLMTGATTTAVRAALMALLALIAGGTGRLYQNLWALGVAAYLMILISPRILIFDISFQLSFLATLGVIIGPRLLESRFKLFRLIPERFGIREMSLTTISAQLLVLPWIVYKMGQLSLVALPINVLVLAFVPLTMLLGALTGLIGFVSYWLSLPFAYASYIFLAYDLKLVVLFASLPFAAVTFQHFPLILVILGYAGYAYYYRPTKTGKADA